MAITKELFGTLPNGQDITAYLLDNGNGVSARILNYGGIVRNLYVEDKNGVKTDVVLGRETMEDYLNNDGFLGALIGRHANRIAGGEFELNGTKYNVGLNEGKNSLHGGITGFDKKVWSAEEVDGEEPSLKLSIVSEDGEEGFPGTLKVTVTYTLTKGNALKINYSAVTDKDTVVNLTNHSYFNLAGHASGTIDNQILQINSEFYTPNDSECMPTGEVLSVMGTPFDFRAPKPIPPRLRRPRCKIPYPRTPPAPPPASQSPPASLPSPPDGRKRGPGILRSAGAGPPQSAWLPSGPGPPLPLSPPPRSKAGGFPFLLR